MTNKTPPGYLPGCATATIENVETKRRNKMKLKFNRQHYGPYTMPSPEQVQEYVNTLIDLACRIQQYCYTPTDQIRQAIADFIEAANKNPENGFDDQEA